MQRLEKIVGKTFTSPEGKVYAIGFKIFTDIKHKDVNCHIGVHWIDETNIGKSFRFVDIYCGISMVSLQDAIDLAFKQVKLGQFIAISETSFDSFGLQKQILKILGE